MNDKAKPFSSKRWTDIPRFVVVGHSEFTEEEKKYLTLYNDGMFGREKRK